MAPRTGTDRSIGTPCPSRLGDVVDVMLDRGVVVDFYARGCLTDLEIVTVDGRIVVASIDTYFRFADAVARLGAAAGGQVTADSPSHGGGGRTRRAAGGRFARGRSGEGEG